ncbi:MAG: adenine deaminase [Bacteroidota bacterium]|nr:adenine deaminase [Bacteroidota bacterium]
MKKKYKANIVDVVSKEIYYGEVSVNNNKISKISRIGDTIKGEKYILPGFVDSHIHIESSMLSPIGFANIAVKHGTVATVSDPHEIANVLGEEGVNYMIDSGKKVPLKFFFGAPSCVPATPFETSGAVLDSKAIKKLLEKDDIYYLAEMMNFPGVIFKDNEVMQKIKDAHLLKKPIDGHAPGLSGDDLNKYAEAGISTDHECSSLAEAEEKIAHGMNIQIRDGSAAKNFEALFPLIDKYPEKVMVCMDDCHPDDLLNGHINRVIKNALKKNCDLFNILRAVTLNPIKHYNLNVGLLQENDSADFIIVDNLNNFNVQSTIIDGNEVFANNKVMFDSPEIIAINNFNCSEISLKDIEVKDNNKNINVILAKDGDLYTTKETVKPKIVEGKIVQDLSRDILKVVIVNRYKKAEPVVGFIKNFGLKKGAIAGSIAHDSHNIIAIGASDNEIVNAISVLVENKGGIVACENNNVKNLVLDIAGLMSSDTPEYVANTYSEINAMAKSLGSKLHAPFMTMAFMSLLVIPELKIGDRGLFDVNKFDFVSLFGK